MKQYSFIKQSMPGLVARGASILATRVKMSRRPSGAVSSVLQRLGLRTPPPAGPNIGASVARGLGYGALAAPIAAYGGARAYGLSDKQIGDAIGNTALGLMGGVAEADDRSMSIGAMRDFDRMINGPLYLEDSAPAPRASTAAPLNSRPAPSVGAMRDFDRMINGPLYLDDDPLAP